MSQYLFYGFVCALIVAVIIGAILFLQGLSLPPLFYIGVVVFFTPFAAWCRSKEMERKNREEN